MDVDNSGHLDREEFEAVMMVLFGNVLMRVLFQYACTLLLVPILAQYVWKGLCWLIQWVYTMITTLDEHSKVADAVEVSLESIWNDAVLFWKELLPWEKVIPTFVYSIQNTLQGWLAAVPSSVWDTVPLTFISAILSLMLIPWSLLKIDDYFQSIADKKAKED